MKRYLLILIIGFSTAGLNSCGTSYATANTNKWLEYELPPSRIVINGDIFFGGKLSDGSAFFVVYDNNISNDADYYYTLLMQDFGWSKKNDDTWTSLGGRERKYGHIYINPARGVAIYFYPERTYSAFKLNIKN